MAPKEDSKAQDALLTVNIDDFTRTRDSVIISLAQLQAAVSDLSRAYINHANTVLNRPPTGLDLSSLTAGGLSGGLTSLLETSLLAPPRAASPGAKSETGEKKKRKRAPPDPNAPKRALTPYFLYMQHNRARIAEELGPQSRPKDVADEGTRRWAEMPETQKEVWKKLYADNLAVYKEKMKAYKAGLPVPEGDQAAKQLHEDMAVVEPTEEESNDDSESEEDESSPEPAKEPTPPPSNKRRRSDAPKTPKKASPEKKKRNTKKDKEEEQPAPASTRKAPAENKRATKKKRKSEIAEE
ncbi:hypothetical protein ASPZODRAFT_131356 [Penicilliopsis zonata CBS 506.65]|uniref:HMG box domain-containing protein n=1 Tax=Penicilliopsis zonata CBS 506.65 TaxID=1073090 RepID=A0A1L9SKU4_9EURO|nr:hypothetical protein ASPZODRAFT_131356 [Penicilliopsis zonata CBS 506.65]OJJ47785.1 hypothetical protein ASPZODRAFT_131356 [Penicilliopsis zonata CBS 506.65]